MLFDILQRFPQKGVILPMKSLPLDLLAGYFPSPASWLFRRQRPGRSNSFRKKTQTPLRWNGFGSDFAPYSLVVPTTPQTKQAIDGLFGGTWGTLMGGRVVLDYAGPQWTVNKISSSTRVAAQADATFSSGRHLLHGLFGGSSAELRRSSLMPNRDSRRTPLGERFRSRLPDATFEDRLINRERKSLPPRS